MNTRLYRFVKPLFLTMSILAAACTTDVESDEQLPLSDGMGRIKLTLCTPESNPDLTRAVNVDPWEEPDHDWEVMHSYRVLICNTQNKVVQIITSDNPTMTAVNDENRPYAYKQTEEIVSEPLPAGDYYIYATANYNDGYDVGQTVNLDRTEKFPNGYSATSEDYFGEQRNIPMTGKLTQDDNKTLKPVTVVSYQQTDAGVLTVWRVMAKLQFEFVNESTEKIRIKGIEVDPINKVSSSGPGVFLFSKDVLTSIRNLAPGANPPSGQEGITLPTNARSDMGPVRHEPATPLELAAVNDGDTDEGNIFFYVNESDATFTTTENQYSLRFRVQRAKVDNPTSDDDWYDEEYRYGLTTQHDLSENGTYGGYNGGFNVIRRNDWIHIPVRLTDWQFRLEPIPFVPIAGYPAATLSSDGLTATFNTGGPIILQPFFKKRGDPTWRDFSNPDITFAVESWDASITWKNSDGEKVWQEGTQKKIIKLPFKWDPDSQCIYGELNNDMPAGTYMTTLTLKVKLGKTTETQYIYTFSCNIILKSES